MKRKQPYLLFCAVVLVASCGYIKPKVFTWNRPVPATPSFSIDSTYHLYMRSICRDSTRSTLMVNGVSVFRDECHQIDKPNVLIERQYLYYSPVHRTAVFIMLLPNYPRGNNEEPMFDLPRIRNEPVVNLWNANCFLFGSLNEDNNLISFKHWEKALYDDWEVRIDPSGQFVEVLAVTERKPGQPALAMRVEDELSVNVIYRKVDPVYPLNVDGTMYKDQHGKKCSLIQRFYYEETEGKDYRLIIPYCACEFTTDPNEGIAFKGKKNSRSRLAYDVGPFFK